MNVRRSRLLRCAIAAAALPAFGPARGADLAPVAGEIGFRLGWRDVELCAEPPARLRRVPTRRSDYAQYLAIPLGSGTNNVIGGCLDESRGAGTGYDLLYLDANGDRGRGKGIYLEILEAAHDCLSPGALVLAHNSVNAAEKLHDYLAFVRDPAHMTASLNIILDPEGLEVSAR